MHNTWCLPEFYTMAQLFEKNFWGLIEGLYGSVRLFSGAGDIAHNYK